jgi:hypothetical protein
LIGTSGQGAYSIGVSQRDTDMTAPDFGNLFDKVKSATKQAGDQASKLARIAKLKANVLSLNSEKERHLKTIGIRAVILFSDEKSTDGEELKNRVRDELAQIHRINERVQELNDQISQMQAGAPDVDVTDVTKE